MPKVCLDAPNGAPVAAPYSTAVSAAGLLFISGQGPMARDGSGVVPGTFEEEARLTLDNLKIVLEDVGSDLEHVVKTTVFLADMERFAEFNAIYTEYFPENFPARTCIQAGRLPLDFQVEVEAIAIPV